MKQELDLRQGLKQTLSQRQIQAVSILQMNLIDLREYIENEAMENPVLSVEYPKNPDSFDTYCMKINYLRQSEENVKSYNLNGLEDDARINVMVSDCRGGLKEFLEEQLLSVGLSGDTKKAARYIIENLDGNGYFTDDTIESARILGVGYDDFVAAFNTVRTFEPFGVGAVNLQDCLLLQLKLRGIDNPRAEEIIKSLLIPLAENKMYVIARKLKCSREAAAAAAGVVKSLNPKPGASFKTKNDIMYMVPDVEFLSMGGETYININTRFFPKININTRYAEQFGEYLSEEDKKYIEKKFNSAKWTMDCISRRNETLLAISKAILHFQKDFFMQGREKLKPLSIKEVAAFVNLHESTVSRAVKGKYAQTAFGIFPMSFFFSRSVPFKKEETELKAGGENLSATTVKAKIREIIENEDRQKPLSDREIANILNSKGIDIKRRTVAKYREAMGIKTSVLRREFI